MPHEGRFVIRLENERLSQIQLRYVLVRIVSLSVVVYKNTAHAKAAEGGRIFLRIFQKNKRARVSEADISREPQAFGEVAAGDFSASFVFLLLCTTNFVQREREIDWEL